MKLLIDIPEETYSFVKQLQWVSTSRGNCKTIQQTVINSIKFGVKPPQGKWIMIKNSDGYLKCYECSECKKSQGYISNFCEGCGADMRKGGAE